VAAVGIRAPAARGSPDASERSERCVRQFFPTFLQRGCPQRVRGRPVGGTDANGEHREP